MKHQINSFKVAFKGIWFTIKSESHMRFHIIAGIYVILFSFFYKLSIAQWAVVILLIGLIMMAELFNTSLEQLCNLSTDSYNHIAKTAKDVAAGAVLLLSFGAIAVAILFYFKIDKITYIFNFLIGNPILLILFVISVVISVLFIGFGPNGAVRLYHKIKAKK